MKTILILGAGKSTPVLITYLLQNAERENWKLIVADQDEGLARERLNGHPRGTAERLDIRDTEKRVRLLKSSDVVINMLTRPFQHMIALECLHLNTHVLTASYEDPKVGQLHQEAIDRNVLILNEMGLDPGIDHMSGMAMVERVRNKGGMVTGFRSYGGGLPAPEMRPNPLNYVITWNPRNVLMAGEDGAIFKEDNRTYVLPFHEIFRRTWPVQIPGIGRMEAYPNRDSLAYIGILGLDHVHTMIRGTLRYPGWSETWYHLVRLGLTNEILRIPNLKDITYGEMVGMFLPNHSKDELEQEVAEYLDVNPTGEIMDKLRWLGLFSDDKIGFDARTISDVMLHLIQDKLAMPKDGRDMVILMHEIEATYPDEKNRVEMLRSLMIDYGKPNGPTAIAHSVGLPVAITARLLLRGELNITGCRIPTRKEIYEPVLRELAKEGIGFTETTVDNL